MAVKVRNHQKNFRKLFKGRVGGQNNLEGGPIFEVIFIFRSSSFLRLSSFLRQSFFFEVVFNFEVISHDCKFPAQIVWIRFVENAGVKY